MHKPVMVREVLEYLNPPVGGVVVDATVGAGGHARALAERVGREGTLIALDRDAQMLALAQQKPRRHRLHGVLSPRRLPKFT
jgi:16S rRNA (cytosine1402-N4)-methyltransferase